MSHPSYAVRGLVPLEWRRLLRPGVLSSLVVAGLLAATALSTLSPSSTSDPRSSRLSGQAGSSKKGGLLPRLFSSEKGTHPNFVVILTDDQVRGQLVMEVVAKKEEEEEVMLMDGGMDVFVWWWCGVRACTTWAT